MMNRIQFKSGDYKGRIGFIITCLVTTILIFLSDYSWHQHTNINHIIDQYWPIIFVAAILIGLPHGASDPIISYRSVWHNTRDLVRFLILYLALAVLIIVTWWYLPDICFLLFWFYSAWHFGYDWSPQSQPRQDAPNKNNEGLSEAHADHKHLTYFFNVSTLTQAILRLGYGLCLLGLCLLFTDDSTIKTLSIITELSHQV